VIDLKDAMHYYSRAHNRSLADPLHPLQGHPDVVRLSKVEIPPSQVKSKEAKISTEDFACTWESCSKKYQSRTGLSVHVKRDHELVTRQSPLCVLSFSTCSNLSKHRKLFHP